MALGRFPKGSRVKALKFRLGGRMSRNADDPPGRAAKLIVLARRAFGPGMTLYGDANSSYDVPNAARIGRLMEEHGYGFFASFTPNVGPFMEFKGNPTFPVTSATSSLRVENGSVRCPTGPGFGVTVAPEFVRAAQAVKVG